MVALNNVNYKAAFKDWLLIHILSGNPANVYITDWQRVWKMSWKWLIYIWNSAFGSKGLLQCNLSLDFYIRINARSTIPIWNHYPSNLLVPSNHCYIGKRNHHNFLCCYSQSHYCIKKWLEERSKHARAVKKKSQPRNWFGDYETSVVAAEYQIDPKWLRGSSMFL